VNGMRARTAGVALLVLLVAAQAQGRSSTCIVQYEHHNQIDYGPLIVQEVKGTITDPQQVAVPKVCVGIFTENDHKLIATTESDADGKFSLQTVPPGRYRLSFSPLLLSRRRISFSGVAAQLCLLCALLPQVLYSVRSERMLMEQLDYNLLFRWFVGLNMDPRDLECDGVREELSATPRRCCRRVLCRPC
jgi:hypothetical protein